VGTRSVIARPAGDGWQGRACHYDGYPDHQGRVLFDAVTGHFAGDVNAACRYLIDEHPAGWSFLGGDFTQPPGFHAAGNAGGRNQCYCHGDRDEPAESLLDPGTARACSTQYAYVLASDGMRVLRASRGGWDQLAELAWDDQPDWHAIQPSP